MSNRHTNIRVIKEYELARQKELKLRVNRHPAMRTKNITINIKHLKVYVEKYQISKSAFMKFTKLSQKTTDKLLEVDLDMLYVNKSTAKKLVDSFYNNIEEEFKIDIKQLIPDEWEDFTDET